MNCEYCNCALIETENTFEVEWEDGDDLQNYHLCLECVDEGLEKDEKVVAVWKFGTSIEVDEDVCYGKHCYNKTGLSRRLGLKRHSEGVFSEELYCNECAVYCCFADCKSCSNEFPMTELRYVSGGIFRDSFDVYKQLHCVPCIESVIDYCDRTGYMAGDFN